METFAPLPDENMKGPSTLSINSASGESSQDGAILEEQVLEKVRSSAFVVDWHGEDDAGNPQNLSVTRKALISISLAMYALTTTFASSVFSAASGVMAEEFGVSRETMVLGGTSLFMVGFATGPTLFGPLSEAFGRKGPLLAGYIAFAALQLPVIDARSATTIFVFRFLQGVCGAAPSSILVGVLADIWTPKQRGFAVPSVGSFLAIGPCLGPLIANMLVQSPTGWRGIEYVTAVTSLSVAALTLPVMCETYPPLLLARRAKRLRIITQNWALRSKSEESQSGMSDIAERYLLRPARMLILEPILLFMTLYVSVSFGLLYNFFLAYPTSFASERGWSPTAASLPLISVMIGVILAGGLISGTVNSRLAPNPQAGRPQETRLLLMMVGAVSLPLGMFWFAYASSLASPWPQIIAGVPTGFGIHVINSQGINYIADCYGIYANSAIAANTFLRSLFAAGFPYVAARIYSSIGVQGGTTILALLATSLTPIPVVLFYFGKSIRARSRWVPPTGM